MLTLQHYNLAYKSPNGCSSKTARWRKLREEKVRKGRRMLMLDEGMSFLDPVSKHKSGPKALPVT